MVAGRIRPNVSPLKDPLQNKMKAYILGPISAGHFVETNFWAQSLHFVETLPVIL